MPASRLAARIPRWITAVTALAGFIPATVIARVVMNTVDSVAIVTDNGRQLVVTGPVQCTAGERAFLRVTVTNAAPQLSSIANQNAYATQALQLTAFFSDPGTRDTQTARITWGDGSAEETIHVAAGASSFNLSHTYASPGLYTVTIHLSDKDGADDQITFQVNVSAPVYKAFLPLILHEYIP